MVYLFFQTGIWLLSAAFLGLFMGWLIWGRSSDEDRSGIENQLHACQKRCQELEKQVEGVATSYSENMGEASHFVSTTAAEDSSLGSEAENAVSGENKPAFLSAPDGEVDDLKKISGVGSVLEKTLNELGIFHYQQIAEFTDEHIEWVDNYLSFTGRINREDWVGQAKKLAEGQSTGFSNRYDTDES